jgi:hypothetical protein
MTDAEAVLAAYSPTKTTASEGSGSSLTGYCPGDVLCHHLRLAVCERTSFGQRLARGERYAGDVADGVDATACPSSVVTVAVMSVPHIWFGRSVVIVPSWAHERVHDQSRTNVRHSHPPAFAIRPSLGSIPTHVTAQKFPFPKRPHSLDHDFMKSRYSLL